MKSLSHKWGKNIQKIVQLNDSSFEDKIFKIDFRNRKFQKSIFS